MSFLTALGHSATPRQSPRGFVGPRLLFAALLLTGCGGGGATYQPVFPRSPKSGDLRFQQVDAPSVANMGTGNGLETELLTGETAWYDNATGSPLGIGSTADCIQGQYNCDWSYIIDLLPPGMTGLTVYYQSLNYQEFSSEMLPMLASPNVVLTSLDFDPASYAYAASWIQTVQTGGFDYRREVVPPSQMQATATQDGLQSRVITAVSFDAQRQANLFSYGWQGDTTTMYESETVISAPENIASSATTLASQGYILTAFGGDDTDGYVLVGTRVQGDRLLRPIMIVPIDTIITPGELAGFAEVASISTLTSAGWTQIRIYEQ